MKETPSKKQKRENRIKKSIIRSAKQLFSQKGYKDTSIDEITDKALIAKATLYHYFESKEKLFLETMIDSEKNLHEILEEKILKNKKLDKKQKLQALFFYMLNYFEKDYYLVHLIFYRESYFNETIIEFIKNFIKNMADKITKILHDYDLSEKELENFAISMIGSIYIHLVNWFMNGRKESLKEIAKILFRQYYAYTLYNKKK